VSSHSCGKMPSRARGLFPADLPGMRRWILTVSLASGLLVSSLSGAPLPLTAKDIGLMLRSGYSSKSVEQELIQRRFVGSLDLEQEETLVKAGASQDLVAAINSGAYSLSAEDSAKAEQKISELSQKRAILANSARTADARYQEQVLRERAAAAKENEGATATTDFLNGCLVRFRDGTIVPAEDNALAKKKLILFYFSAHWCGPCRQFTPKLIDYYNRVVAAHPEVELVFYSLDRSAKDMESYMRETGMPWLAIDYDKRQEKPELSKTAGNSIPALFLVERTGRLLSNTVVDGKYVGPEKVLTDLDGILSGKSTQLAQTH
jgi:nucleoredoxin